MRLTENEILYATMKRKRLTMQRIADALGFSKSFISKSLAGARQSQSERIAKYIRSYKPKGIQ
jgi:transcriptional regulator with XRE-family HTH domain